MKSVALASILVCASIVGACTDDEPGTLRIYTTVTQATVDSVVEGFSERYPDVDVEVFRAPTGELTARIAAEQREGGMRADVLWLTDPLSMQQYAGDGLLA
jgi:iron(III) transport system substrate-binding protein